MKTNKTIFFFVILLISSCSGKHKSDKQYNEGEPKFAIQPEFHNFGDLESGEVVYFNFKVTNSGSGILIIDSIDSGCGCIVTNLDNTTIKPGQTERLQVVFNSAGEWGNIYKPIVLFTNTKEKEKEFYITAKVNNQLFNR